MRDPLTERRWRRFTARCCALAWAAWLHTALESATLDDFGVRQIPIFTELRDYLGTLLLPHTPLGQRFGTHDEMESCVSCYHQAHRGPLHIPRRARHFKPLPNPRRCRPRIPLELRDAEDGHHGENRLPPARFVKARP